MLDGEFKIFRAAAGLAPHAVHAIRPVEPAPSAFGLRNDHFDVSIKLLVLAPHPEFHPLPGAKLAQAGDQRLPLLNGRPVHRQDEVARSQPRFLRPKARHDPFDLCG